MSLDKKIYLQNIDYLIKKNGMTKKELTKKVGLNETYFSRNRDETNSGVITQVGYVKEIADLFGVSVDVLLTVNLKDVSDDNEFIIKLIKKFENETETRKVAWKRIDTHIIWEYMAGKIQKDSTLFMLENEPNSINTGGVILPQIYKSHYYGQILIQGGQQNQPVAYPWFTLELNDNKEKNIKNTVILTYMYRYSSSDDTYKGVVELYINTATTMIGKNHDESSHENTVNEGTPLCNSEVMGEAMGGLLITLYNTVFKHQNDIIFNNNAKSALDSYLQG